METTEDLVRRHGSYLRRLALALVHDEATARDVEQETWRVALERRDARVEKPREWLGGIARRIAWRRSRDEARRAVRERDAARSEGADGERSIEWSDALQAALRRLDEPLRDTVAQRYLMDRPPREIARRTGEPLETVKSRLKRGLAALRADLDRRHGGDRRAWSLGLAGALDLPGPSLAATPSPDSVPDPTGLVSRGTHPASATSNPWMTRLAMYAKPLATVAVVASVSVWAFDGFDRSDRPQDDTSLSAPGRATHQSALAPIDEIPAVRRATGAVLDEPVFAAPDGAFSLAMEFETRNQLGDPLAGVTVQLAPPNHPFVVAGETDGKGRLALQWSSREPAMTVDVAFRSWSGDFGGIQRVRVSDGAIRRIVLQAAAEVELLVGEEWTFEEAEEQPEEPQRPSPLRGVPEATPDGSLTFATEAEREAVGGLLPGFGFFEDVTEGSEFVFEGVEVQPNGRVSAVEGTVVDELGQPAALYPVRFTVGDGSLTGDVLTDDEGHYRIEVEAESVRLAVGAGEGRIEWSTPLEPGRTVDWSPRVERGRDLMLVTSSVDGAELGGGIVQVRHDDGETLWIGRTNTDESGRATLYGCPVERVEVDLIDPDGAALPVVTLESVPTGSPWQYELDAETLSSAVALRWTPMDGERSSASATELVLLDESKGWGDRVRVGGALGSMAQVNVPHGKWWLELATRGTGRTGIGSVHLLGSEPVDLGQVPLAPTGRLALSGLEAAASRVTVDWIRGDVDSRVATRTGDELPEVLTLAPGRYRVTTTAADGTSSSTEVDVVANERSEAR